MDAIKKHADDIEKRANMDEKLMAAESSSGKVEVEKAMAVNDMYIEAISAKLKILD